MAHYLLAMHTAWRYGSKPLLTLLCYTSATLAANPVYGASSEDDPGFAPFARVDYTYDSNLLNRSDEGDGPEPQSDQVKRLALGTLFNAQVSRQKFSGLMSLSDTRHQRFTERNTDGYAYRLRWDSEIGKTIRAAVEKGAVSDQAPIQTGLVSANVRKQDTELASLTWNFHANYAVLSEYKRTETRFEGASNNNDALLNGLNRDDQSGYIGLAYQPSSGSSSAILLKQSSGFFPSRQIIGPGQTVSNNFDQSEVEWLTRWNYSKITTLTLSLASVNRQHDELPQRDFSGTNYRVAVRYEPTVKTSFDLMVAKQLVGVSDATNSDALARQVGLGMQMELTSKLFLQLGYMPQNLEFNGTDGFSTVPRTERLKESRIGLEFQMDPRLKLGANLRQRDRDSSLPNLDYTAHSMNVFVKYEH